MREPRTVLQQSMPVLITSMVNKSGAIGVSILPMLLVEGRYSTAESSLAMSLVKGSTVVATLASGWFSDTIGLRATVLCSFLCAAVGFGFLPVDLGFAALVAAGVIAQLGITSVNGSLRLLLTRTVEWHHQKEALGWMRFANSLAQVLSFGLGTLAATLGARLLIWFDGLTSLMAFALGVRILPRTDASRRLDPAIPDSPGNPNKGSWPAFVGAALLLTGWSFTYEFFLVGIAGRLKVIYPEEGLRIFSVLMVFNTLLCAAWAVAAARALARVVPSLFIGIILGSAGVILSVWRSGSLAALFAAALLMTLGEIIYGALGQLLLIRAVPPSRRENTLYASGMLVTQLGRLAAAGLAFPLIVDATSPLAASWIAAGVGAASLVVLALGNTQFRDLFRE